MQLATLQETCEGPLVLRHSLSAALPFNQMQLAALQSTCEGPVVLRHSLSTALPFYLVTLYTPRRDLSIGFFKKF